MHKMRRVLAVGLMMIAVIQEFPAVAAAPAQPAEEAAVPPKPPVSTTPGTKEPMIEVSVDTLEISESDHKAVGISWGQSGGSNQNTGQPIFDANHLNFNEASPVPAVFEAGKFIRTPFFAQLQALIQNNQARVLANPTLLTKSGFEANFVVGGEIPYPTVGQGGVGGVEFKKYGVILKILPQVTARQTIEAMINVSVTNPDSSVAIVLNGTSVPGLSSREAGSKVEVIDGETVVLAGIKQSTRNKIVSRVPILGYIPLVGLLFRSTTETVAQTSLVFFVTFRLIK